MFIAEALDATTEAELLTSEIELDQEVIEFVEAGKDLFSGDFGEIAVKLGTTLLILLVGYIVVNLVMKVIKKALGKSRMDGVLHTFFINCAKIVMWVVVITTALNYLGLPPTSFLTILGAAGVAIALALQDSLGNFAGGILIILSKPFSKGDFIENSETSGKVEQIDLLYTTLKTYDNKVITIPNGKLANSTIINYTREGKRRVDCKFTVSYSTDLAQVKDVLTAVAESDPRIHKTPAPVIGVAGLKESGIELDLKVWCDTGDVADVNYFVQEQVRMAFEVADITIPYPQMEVTLKKQRV